MQHDMWPPERPAFDGTVTRITSFTPLQVPVYKYVLVFCMHTIHTVKRATSCQIKVVEEQQHPDSFIACRSPTGGI